MTTEFELIRRYRGAFTSEECDKLIDYIDNFEKTNLLVYDTENLHQVDNKTINISNYDFPAYSQLATDILTKFKPCVDEYIEAVSILKPYKFLLFDMKIKKIPIGGGFHSWHFENGSIPYAQRKFVVQLYLNDDFDGGETEIMGEIIVPKKNYTLIFPSNWSFLHRGLKVKSGIKKIMVVHFYANMNRSLL